MTDLGQNNPPTESPRQLTPPPGPKRRTPAKQRTPALPDSPSEAPPSNVIQLPLPKRRTPAPDGPPPTPAAPTIGSPIPVPPPSYTLPPRTAPTLSAAHARMLLEESGISMAVVHARGYVTLTEKRDLLARGFQSYQARMPGLLVPRWTTGGHQDGFQFRPDTPRRRQDGGDAIKYESPEKQLNRLDVPPGARAGLTDLTVPLFITEGARKADAACTHGLTCVSLAGVFGWKGAVLAGSKATATLPDWDDIVLNGRMVYIVFDSDIVLKREVRRACQRLRAMLERKGATVHVLHLPAGPGDAKTGLDDYFARDGGTAETLLALPVLDAALGPAPVTGRAADAADLITGARVEAFFTAHPKVARRADAPTVVMGTGHGFLDVIGQVWVVALAANDPPELFGPPTKPRRLETDDETGRPLLVPLTEDRLKHWLRRIAEWLTVKKTKDGEYEMITEPPDEVVEDMLAQPSAPWPPLRRIVEHPYFTASGLLVQVPGYDPESAVYYLPPGGRLDFPAIPAQPTPAQVVAARDLIVGDLLGDFKFVNAASRAHAVALNLLPLVRPMIDGATPLHDIESPGPREGKGLLLWVLLWPALGRPPEVITEAESNAEWRKLLLSMQVEGADVIAIDNTDQRLDSAALASAITEDGGQGRRLGHTEMLRHRNRPIWAALGNNPRHTKDLAGRSAPIRIDAGTEHPEERTDFRHPGGAAGLKAWTAAHRIDLLVAACTLVQAWLAAGSPRFTARTLGGFEQWTAVMGGILDVAGVPGFLEDRAEAVSDTDDESTTAREVVDTWASAAALPGAAPAPPGLPAAFLLDPEGARSAAILKVMEFAGVELDLGAARDAHSRRVAFGIYLRKLQDRTIGPWKIVRAGRAQRALLWKLVPRGRGRRRAAE